MTQNQLVEKKAKELYNIFWSNNKPWENYSIPPTWIKLSRKVLADELKAAISERLKFTCDISELTAQLKETEKE